jgi:hypothetical protein
MGRPGITDCDDSQWSPGFRSSIVATTEKTPDVVFEVQRSFTSTVVSLSPDASRVVLSAPEVQRVNIAAQFDPRMAEADTTGESPKLLASMVFHGDGLVSQQIIFIDDRGDESAVYPEAAPKESIWYSGFENKAQHTFEGGIRNFINGWAGSHAGTFVVRIRDVGGRNTVIPLVDAAWTSNGAGNSVVEHWKVLPS